MAKRVAKKHTAKKGNQAAWFIKIRGSYLPANWKGALTYIPFVAFLVAVLVDALQTKNTAASVFYMVFPQWVAAVVVMTWLASRKS